MSQQNVNERKYGQWTEEREEELADAMVAYHPTYGYERDEKKEAWDKVAAAVNAVQEGEKKKLSVKTIQNKYRKLKRKYEQKQFRDARSSGSTPGDTPKERKILEVMTQVINKLAKCIYKIIYLYRLCCTGKPTP